MLDTLTQASGQSSRKIYRAEACAVNTLDWTSPLWEIEGQKETGIGAMLFSVTAGNLRGKEASPPNSWPTILIRLADGWKIVNFKDDFFRFTWQHVAAATARGYIWGFLDYAVEGSWPEIPVILSTDRGRTWVHVSSIPKPDHEATLHSFEMGPDGRGTLRMVLEGGPTGTRRIFTFLTKDWGRTWEKVGRPVISALEEGVRVSPDHCDVAVRNLPDPLPSECRLSESIREVILEQNK